MAPLYCRESSGFPSWVCDHPLFLFTALAVVSLLNTNNESITLRYSAGIPHLLSLLQVAIASGIYPP